MAYQKGEVQIEEEECYLGPAGTLYLPHSCDEWVIGGEVEARQLIADIEALLAPKEKETPPSEEQS